MIAWFKNIARKNGYEIYTEPFKLNIWGIRSRSETPNKFDDVFHVFYNTSKGRIKRWSHHVFKCTTDPGTYWLRNPMQAQGTAILAPRQYLNAYKISLHRGKYYALCQRLGKVEIIRDYDRNALLDFNNGRRSSGMFGINIHRARRTGTTYTVDNFSAGCQVFQNADDFNLFMKLCEMHKKVHGNKFTYTLIDRRMEFKRMMKRLAIGTISLGVITGGLMWWNEYEQNKGR